jgi:beta-glucosidase
VHNRVAAVRAGLDLEMPGTAGQTDADVVTAVRSGELDESLVDAAARRVLTLVARTYPGDGRVNGAVMDRGHTAGDRLTPEQLALLGAEEHHELAREAAAACITLLRNEPVGSSSRPALPLAGDAAGTIAVIGAFAEHARIQGGGSSGVDPTFVDVPLDALRSIAGDRIAFAPGYVYATKNAYQDDNLSILAAHGITHDEERPKVARRSATLAKELQLAEAVQHAGRGPLSEPAQRLIDEAVELAAQAETIVVFAGLPLSSEQEANDRASLDLPADQVALLSRLADLRERTGASLIVVLSTGSPVSMDPWHDRVDAVVEAWLSGQGTGRAVADVLFGHHNPSGRIAETFPFAVEDTPGYPNWIGERGTVLYGEGVFIGYRWYDAHHRAVRYPFGHGLSYTTFTYSELAVHVLDAAAGRVRASLTVANAGDRDGDEIVQLYVGDPDAEVHRPLRELRGFEKVRVRAGESVRVSFELESRDFAYWDSAAERPDGRTGLWRREGGEFVIEAGASSRDIRLRAVIDLPDDPTIPPLVHDAELQTTVASRFVDGHAG